MNIIYEIDSGRDDLGNLALNIDEDGTLWMVQADVSICSICIPVGRPTDELLAALKALLHK